MKLNRYIVTLMLTMCVVGFTMNGVSAAKLHFNGSTKLLGHIDITTNYYDNNILKTKTILSENTRWGHREWTVNIPSEAKYNDISVRQSVTGAPANTYILLMNYHDGDVDIDFSLNGATTKASASRLRLTYEGVSVVANSDNGYATCWARKSPIPVPEPNNPSPLPDVLNGWGVLA